MGHIAAMTLLLMVLMWLYYINRGTPKGGKVARMMGLLLVWMTAVTLWLRWWGKRRKGGK